MKKNIISYGLILVLSACANIKPEFKYPKNEAERARDESGSILTGSKERFSFGKNYSKDIEINKNLWVAALEVMSFMPFLSTDIKTGLIITDWYSPNDAKNERFKFNIIILNNKLKINTLKITGFKEVSHNGKWQQAKISPELVTDLERKILNKARKINISNQ